MPMNKTSGRFAPVRKAIGLLACAVLLSACGGHYPADPHGTLDRVTDGTIRVGVSHQPPFTDTSSAGEIPNGIEAQLLQDYAQTIDADIAWEPGGEEHLIQMLSQRELDVVIGGFSSSSPWSSHAALTTSYAESIGVDGSTRKHVMAVYMGENAFMTDLERFLLDQDISQQVPEGLRP